jgi:predicted RecA/RadA family phage recombinase
MANTLKNDGRKIAWSNGTGSTVTGGSVVVLGTGGNRWIAVLEQDTANGVTGTLMTELYGIHYLTALSTDVASQGDIAYWDTTNSRITVTKGTNVVAGVFEAAKANGETTAAIKLRGAPVSTGTVFNQVAASTAVTNTTSETAFDQSYTFVANALKAGQRINIRAQVIATATNSTDTLTVKLKIGSTVIVATAAVDVANSDIAYIDADVTIRTDGASGTIVAAGHQALGTPGTVTAKPFNLASTAIDTTATQAITVTATWSVASASNSCRLDQLIITQSV